MAKDMQLLLFLNIGIAYADSQDPDQTFYLSLPKGKRDVPLLIFFHGGGMTGGTFGIIKEKASI